MNVYADSKRLAGLLGMVLGAGLVASCGHAAPKARTTAARCPAALHEAEVRIRHEADGVIVRIDAAGKVSPANLAANADTLVEALSRHSETVPTVSADVRPAPGRRVAVSTDARGIELAFTAADPWSVEVLRRRIDKRVSQWQRGQCPISDRMLETKTVSQS